MRPLFYTPQAGGIPQCKRHCMFYSFRVYYIVREKISNVMFNFEAPSPLELQISREMEKIELAHAKMAEKFEGHADCLAFIDFLKATEKIFTESKFRKWDAQKSMEEMIRIETGLASKRSGVPPEIFASISDEFQKSYSSIGKISDIAEELLKKYENDKDCQEFIQYIKDIYISFDDIRRGGREMIDVKYNLVQAKMQVLSSDGNPNFKMLEEIYDEFKNMIK